MMFRRHLKEIVLSVVTLTVCVLIAMVLVYMRQDVKKAEPKERVTLVDIEEVKLKKEPIEIAAWGTVQGDRKLAISPEVVGQVVAVSPNFVLGGVVKKGERLLKIDPRDYQFAIEKARAAMQKADFDLKVEEGFQIVAEREWELLKPGIVSSELSEQLALRVPHLEEKKAALKSAKSQLDKALLDLKRTELRSPFNAIVTEENVEVGQYVTTGTALAQLEGTDRFRILVSFPYEELGWIDLPTAADKKGSAVRIIQEVGGSAPIMREGYVLRLLGDLSPKGRMVRLLVAVEDPLGLTHPKWRKAPLLIGTYVKVLFQGPVLEGIFVLPREAIREGDRVYVMNDKDELEVKDVNILFRREADVVINEGLEEGDRVVVSVMSLAIPGMKLKAVEK